METTYNSHNPTTLERIKRLYNQTNTKEKSRFIQKYPETQRRAINPRSSVKSVIILKATYNYMSLQAMFASFIPAIADIVGKRQRYGGFYERTVGIRLQCHNIILTSDKQIVNLPLFVGFSVFSFCQKDDSDYFFMNVLFMKFQKRASFGDEKKIEQILGVICLSRSTVVLKLYTGTSLSGARSRPSLDINNQFTRNNLT